VVQMQKMLDNAQEELAKEDEANGGENIVEGLRANTTAINPVYDQLQIRLVDADSSLAILQSKIDQQKELITKLDSSSQSMPALQSELGKINRDYDALKNKYDELLKRRESARLAQDLQTKSD